MSALRWARVLVRSLARAGVRQAVLSPGSRSTPVALALDELRGEGVLSLDVIADERSAAFFALGSARVTGAPTLVACTSGSAGAHFGPAAVEASHAGLPLVLLTADRPLELQDCGAPQTVDQMRMFGAFTRASWDLGAPEPGDDALIALSRRAKQAVARARGPEPGPVHLDARFRKPLEPTNDDGDPADADRLVSRSPDVEPSLGGASPQALALLRERCRRAERPLIVAGPSSPVGVLELARALGAPVLAEVTSGLRFGQADVLGQLDILVRAGAVAAFDPDLVIEFGLAPVSSAWAELTAVWGPRRISVSGGAVPSNPSNRASLVILGDVALALPALAEELRRTARPDVRLARAEAVAAEVALRAVREGPLTGGGVARSVALACADADLVIGNSLVVRDLDTFAGRVPFAIRVMHQRGASGIDGLVAGAAGAASASGRRTICSLGDVSLAHDAGSLALLRGLPVTVVVTDNGGGRIFDRLPVQGSLDPERMRRLFHTPVAIDHEALARAHGLAFARADSTGELQRGLALEGPALVVARAGPDDLGALVARTREAIAR